MSKSMEGCAAPEQWYRDMVSEHWESIYNYCFRMSLESEVASSVTETVFRRVRAQCAENPVADEQKTRSWLVKFAQKILEETLPTRPSVSFDLLDDTLRSEATRTDVVRSLGERERDLLLWELKQGCMTSVVNCLSLGERSAFILKNILKMSDDDASFALGVTKASYKVRLSRATKKIADYLAPRCEHIDPLNPCRCPARVGVALANGFIGKGGGVSLRKPISFGRYGVAGQSADLPLREVETIYANLPSPEPTYDLMAAVLDDRDDRES